MPDYSYHVVALIPDGSSFSLQKACTHFTAHGWRCEEVRTASGGEALRISANDWAVILWLEDKPHVRQESAELAEGPFTPVPRSAEVVRQCSRRLSIWSDPDRNFDHTDSWIDTIEELLRAFPELIVFDPVNGKWWER